MEESSAKKNNPRNTIIAIAALIGLSAAALVIYQFSLKTSSTQTQNLTPGQVFKTITMTRVELDTELEDMQAVLMSAKATPYRRGEEETILGFQLSEIQAHSLWTRVGVQENDILTSINGSNLDSTTQAMNLYMALQTESKITMGITRNDIPGIIEINIK